MTTLSDSIALTFLLLFLHGWLQPSTTLVSGLVGESTKFSNLHSLLNYTLRVSRIHENSNCACTLVLTRLPLLFRGMQTMSRVNVRLLFIFRISIAGGGRISDGRLCANVTWSTITRKREGQSQKVPSICQIYRYNRGNWAGKQHQSEGVPAPDPKVSGDLHK